MVRNEETILTLSNDYSEIQPPSNATKKRGKIYLGSAGPCMKIVDNNGIRAGIFNIAKLTLYVDASNAEKYNFVEQFKDHSIDPSFKKFISNIEHYKIEVNDSKNERDQNIMIHHLENVTNKIETHVSQGNSVYVHCRMGMQRSAAIVAAYFMRYYEMTVENALAHVQKHRPIAFGGLLPKNMCKTTLECASFGKALMNFGNYLKKEKANIGITDKHHTSMMWTSPARPC